MNDIELNEVKKFEAIKATLPPSVSCRLKSLNCSVFDILENENLESAIGFFYCRNFVHFLKDEEVAALCPLLKRLSTPDGSDMIFTTNSSYNPSYVNLVLNNPTATRFRTTTCFFYDFDKSRKPTAQIFCDVSVCNEDLDPLSFEKLYLLSKLPGEPKDGGTNGKWRVNPDARKLDSRLMSMFNEKKKNPELDLLFKSAKKAGIEILINTSRCYTRQNLANLLETHGLMIDTTFVLSANGHITNEMYPPHVGVIAKYLK